MRTDDGSMTLGKERVVAIVLRSWRRGLRMERKTLYDRSLCGEVLEERVRQTR